MALTGEKGAIKTGLNSVTKMENWKLNIKANEVDTTSFDSDGWEETEISTKGWELSMEGAFNKADTTGQKAIMAAIASGEDFPVELYTNKDDEKADFSGNVKIIGLDVETTVKDKLKVSIKAKGNGKLTGLEASLIV
ncbi:hypothetical protein SDC9_72736 [bioreactor metagenome]|uniref:Phage major tail protein 2 n=1 Tax=bioreactor metagenome TaxID=1076179 RepID=A0A644YCF3_9ZZZZ